jgi:AcrR family transcriptional regulator
MNTEPVGGTAERLLGVGLRLFARDGYERTSVRALSRAAGVNIGGVRYHFGSKRGLYRMVVRRGVDPLRDRLERILRGGGLPFAQLQTGLREVVDFFRVHPDVARLVQRAFHDPHGTLVGEPEELFTPLRPLGRMIQGAQASGLIRSDEPSLLAMRVLLVSSQISLLPRPTGSRLQGGETQEGGGPSISVCVTLTYLVLEPEEG